MKIHQHNPDLVIDIHLDLNPFVAAVKNIANSWAEIAEVAYCPDAANHLHYANLVNSWPDALVNDEIAVLKVNDYHICKTRMIVEKLA